MRPMRPDKQCECGNTASVWASGYFICARCRRIEIYNSHRERELEARRELQGGGLDCVEFYRIAPRNQSYFREGS